MPRRHVRRVWMLWLLVCLVWGSLVASPPPGLAGQEFSFVVMGDTRGEPFLAGGRAQAAELRRVVAERFRAPFRLVFDPVTGELARVEVAAHRGKEPATIVYREGCPVMILRGRGQGARVVMRRAGRDWVLARVAAALQRAVRYGRGPVLVVHTGDLIIWGKQGERLDTSPFWQDLENRLLLRLPPVEPGFPLPGRFFPAVGNHETWGDKGLKGLTTTLPYLSRLGFSPQRRIYSFRYGASRFIFLDSGGYRKGRMGWWSENPPFAAQMAQLKRWLEQAVAEGSRQVFIVYHKPSFCQAGHGALPSGHNPHPYIRPFARRLSITVLNGHVHTTEAYQVDGVRYLVLGGGGAPQVFSTHPWPGYPLELYWRGRPRVEEYNYAVITVRGQGEPEIRIHRWRPGDVARPLGVAVWPFAPAAR